MNVCLTHNTAIQGWWQAGSQPPLERAEDIAQAVMQLSKPITFLQRDGQLAVAVGGSVRLEEGSEIGSEWPVVAHAPAMDIKQLGDPSFCRDHAIKYPYVAGAMANGIASEELVIAMVEAGMLAFFGSAGLSPARVEQAIDRLQARLGDRSFGFNLIHSPNESELEERIVELYLKKGVRLISASAYMALTPAVVRYRLHGIHENADGQIITPNKIVAKVSRVEVARRFFSPPPDRIVQELLASGRITADEARLAARIPMAQDLTAEADSGGHTDNRPALTLVPTMIQLAERLQAQHKFEQSLRVGAAGGIATPSSTAAAFAMGAAYVVTGSINQSCQEAGTCDAVRAMLAQAGQADIAMAPAADMFEMGVKVQVLKRGTMFAMRAARLYEAYRNHARFEDIPAAEARQIEKQYLRTSFEESWAKTRAFFAERDPKQNDLAQKDPKHKMALVFRSYLGLSSRWANAGEPTRKIDYQVWCGPAMGAFNEWVKGSFLEAPDERRVATVALNLLFGAAVLTRIRQLRLQGLRLPHGVVSLAPRSLSELKERLS